MTIEQITASIQEARDFIEKNHGLYTHEKDYSTGALRRVQRPELRKLDEVLAWFRKIAVEADAALSEYESAPPPEMELQLLPLVTEEQIDEAIREMERELDPERELKF
jgi:hypothetical protein